MSSRWCAEDKDTRKGMWPTGRWAFERAFVPQESAWRLCDPTDTITEPHLRWCKSPCARSNPCTSLRGGVVPICSMSCRFVMRLTGCGGPQQRNVVCWARSSFMVHWGVQDVFPGFNPKQQFSVLLSVVDTSLKRLNITRACRLRP